ncbi:hypothetical protein ACA910_014332 [Epithemia clementina (nom. ined.)]
MEKQVYQCIYKCRNQERKYKANLLGRNAVVSSNQLETFPFTTTTSSTSIISTTECDDVAIVDNVPIMMKKNEQGWEDESTPEDGITAMIVHASAGCGDELTTQNKVPTTKMLTFDSFNAGIEGLLEKNEITRGMHPKFYVCFDKLINCWIFI